MITRDIILRGKICQRLARLTLRSQYHFAVWRQNGSHDALQAYAKLMRRCDALQQAERRLA